MTRLNYFLCSAAIFASTIFLPRLLGQALGLLLVTIYGYGQVPSDVLQTSIDLLRIVYGLTFILTLGYLFSARAKNAGMSYWWVIAGFVPPLGWIILGCFKSVEQKLAAQLRPTQ